MDSYKVATESSIQIWRVFLLGVSLIIRPILKAAALSSATRGVEPGSKSRQLILPPELARLNVLPAATGLALQPAHLGERQQRPQMMSMPAQAQVPVPVWRMMGTARGRSMSRCSDTTREMSCSRSVSLRPSAARSRLPPFKGLRHQR